jgi:hypothetical protein
MVRASLVSLATLAVAALGFAGPACAQVTQLRFDPTKVPQGIAMHYKKSQLDGSNATNVSVYMVDAETLESLKWDEDSTVATLVMARMDWRRFSVREFRSFRLEKGKAPELRGTLEANESGTRLKVSFLDGKIVHITHWPWHSYDFDFASLGLTLPHLHKPDEDLIFWRTDVVFVGEGVDFAEVGGIRLHMEAMELRDSQPVRRYAIGGAGLQHRYGKLWTNASTGQLIEYQIPIGDEPGFNDVRLLLDRAQAMTPAQWEAFKKAKTGER